jgi:hypothetical protein
MLLVNALIFVGLILGGATGFVPLGPIMGMLVPLVAATYFLQPTFCIVKGPAGVI